MCAEGQFCFCLRHVQLTCQTSLLEIHDVIVSCCVDLSDACESIFLPLLHLAQGGLDSLLVALSNGSGAVVNRLIGSPRVCVRIFMMAEVTLDFLRRELDALEVRVMAAVTRSHEGASDGFSAQMIEMKEEWTSVIAQTAESVRANNEE